MRYPVQAYCTTHGVSINAKLSTQGAADVAKAMFYRQHPAETCDVRNGVMPKVSVTKDTKRSTAASDRKDKYVYDDEYHAR